MDDNTSQKPWLQYLFSHPVATFKLNNSSQLNSDLIKLILGSEVQQHENSFASQKIQHEVFESSFDFLNWENPAVVKLKSIFHDRLKVVIPTVNNISPLDLFKLKVNSSSWFHITRNGGYVQPHDHPNASWSIVYCVSPGIKDKNHLDGGALVIQNPSQGVNMYKDPCNSCFNKPMSQNAAKYILSEGDIIIFPSYLSHWVTPFFGTGERITIASNWWFNN